MKFWSLLVLLLGITTVQAQVKEGAITYERKINMYKRITDEQMRAYIPEFRTSKHVLLFSDSASIYKTIPEDEMPEAGNGGNVRVMVRMGGGDADELYKDFTKSKSFRQTDIGAKTYVIEDSIKTQKCKLTDETKTILGYTCRKAVASQTQRIGGSVRMITNMNGNSDTTKNTKSTQTQEVEVVAWYAENIVSPVGPENNGGLPGVILQLDINKGEMLYTAIEIKKEVNKKEVKVPSKGKKITNEEYAKLMQQMMENMQQGGGGRMMRFGN